MRLGSPLRRPARRTKTSGISPGTHHRQQAHRPATASEAAFHARETLKSPRLADLVQLDDPSFRALFSKSPIKRIGRDRFVRNVLYAIGNSGEAGLAEVVRPLLDDPAPVVRDAAEWALGQLPPATFIPADAGIQV